MIPLLQETEVVCDDIYMEMSTNFSHEQVGEYIIYTNMVKS